MFNRSALLLVAGAAIFALDASAALAQDTTRARRPTSTRRIPVTKEASAGGEVTVRVDTLTLYRTDTLQLPGRVDTVATTNTVVRVDTVVQTLPFRIPQVGGLYFGVGAGSSLPAAMFNDSDHPGWRVDVPLGYDIVGSPFGIRFDAGYSRYQPHDWVSALLSTAQTWNFDGDLKLRFATANARMTRASVYGLGGVSYNRFKDILENNAGVLSVGNAIGGSAPPANPDHAWHSGWGWNTGAGVEIGRGRTNVFMEARFNRFQGENSNISHVPVIIGLSWY